MDTLTISIYVLGISILVCFFAGLFTGNYSHVDRLWSVLPPVYAIIWMFEYKGNPGFLIMSFLVVLWGLRLTYNFARRGGYAYKKGFSGEDYRWPIMRERIKNRVLFEVFNLLFISSFQLSLIFAFTLPLYYINLQEHSLSSTDYLFFLFFVILLVLEFVADNQQYKFHAQKKCSPYKEDKRYQLGFNTFGLWKYSRHPNYFAELSQWLVLYLYLVYLSKEWHWSGIGIAVLIALFIGSTRLTEGITAEKYAEYKKWKESTPVLIPYLGIVFRRKKRRAFRGDYF